MTLGGSKEVKRTRYIRLQEGKGFFGCTSILRGRGHRDFGGRHHPYNEREPKETGPDKR